MASTTPTSTNDQKATEETNLEPLTLPPKISAKKPRPSLEGINAPASPIPEVAASPSTSPNPNLTQEEKQLIAETSDSGAKIQTSKPQASKITLPPKKIHYFKFILVIVILAGLGFGIYKLYLYYSNRQVASDNNTNTLPPITQNPQPSPQPIIATPVIPASSSPLTTLNSTTTPTSTSPSLAPAPAQVTTLKITATPTGFLNVRQMPSLTGKILTKVHPGEIYPYTNISNGWYKIGLPDGSTGWVFGRYIVKTSL